MTPAGTRSAAANEIDIMEFISTDGGHELNTAFNRTADQNIQCKEPALVEAVAKHAGN